MLLLVSSGPSMVAVRLGASVMFRTMEVVLGARWKVAGVLPATEVSCHPENPSVAERFPRFVCAHVQGDGPGTAAVRLGTEVLSAINRRGIGHPNGLVWKVHNLPVG